MTDRVKPAPIKFAPRLVMVLKGACECATTSNQARPELSPQICILVVSQGVVEFVGSKVANEIMQRLFVGLISLIVFCTLSILLSPQILDESVWSNTASPKRTSEGISEEDMACRWPIFYRNTSSAKFIDSPDKIVCGKGVGRLVFIDNNGYLVVNNESMATLSYLSDFPISCSYSYFDSAPNDRNRIAYSGQFEFYSFSKEKISLSPVRITKGDFVRVRCYQQKKRSNIVYSDAYAFGTLENKRRSPEFLRHSSTINGTRFSILVIAFDGVSLKAFQRHMPSTYAYLKRMRVYKFRGFTKANLDADSNFMTMLTGKRLSTALFGPENISAPFIWKDFDGYATTLHEDSVHHGLFSRNRFGFEGKPTDFYYRPLYAELRRLRPSRLCGGHRPLVETQLDALERQLIALNDTLQFSVVRMGEMIRENVANLEHVDSAFLDFLRRMNSMHYWEETILFMAGTRGPNTGRLRQELVGVFEERMPLLMIRAPPTFLDYYPEIRRRLSENRRRLVSHFDVYATFRHLLEISKNSAHSNSPPRKSFGSSLFDRIDPGRTCEEAGIPYQFCPCQRHGSLDPLSEDLQRAGRNLMEYVNVILEGHTVNNESGRASNLCWNFEKYRVMRGERFHLDGSWRRESLSRLRPVLAPEHRNRLRVLIKCEPGDALFEAEMIPRSLFTWSVASYITRLDRHESHSYCIQDETVKRFCVCNKPKAGS